MTYREKHSTRVPLKRIGTMRVRFKPPVPLKPRRLYPEVLPNVTKLPKKRDADWPRKCLDSWRDTFVRWEDQAEPVTLGLGTINAIRHSLECNCLYITELESKPRSNVMTQSLLVKLALGMLRDALKEVLTVDNVDAVLDGTIDQVKEAGSKLLERFPNLQSAFESVCDKAKEGTTIAELIVDAINEMTSFSAMPDTTAYGMTYTDKLDSVAKELYTMREALTGCDKDGCKC